MPYKVFCIKYCLLIRKQRMLDPVPDPTDFPSFGGSTIRPGQESVLPDEDPDS